jgi:hypothetical protein
LRSAVSSTFACVDSAVLAAAVCARSTGANAGWSGSRGAP